MYLMDRDIPICYWRGDADQFEDTQPAYIYVPLKGDAAIGKIPKVHEAGMIAFRLSINRKFRGEDAIDFSKFPIWSNPMEKRNKILKCRAYIYQCRDLPAADAEGSSDPYISIWNPYNEKVETTIVYDNMNPIFYECLEFYLYAYDE